MWIILDYMCCLCGRNWAGSISNCYFLAPLDGGGPDNRYGSPLTDDQMKQQSSFVGWDFVSENENGTADIWRMCVDGVEYPKLSWQFMSADFLCLDGVNFIDYTFFAKRWMDTNCGDSNDCDGCDLDFSDTVDANDLQIFCSHWLEGTEP